MLTIAMVVSGRINDTERVVHNIEKRVPCRGSCSATGVWTMRLLWLHLGECQCQSTHRGKGFHDDGLLTTGYVVMEKHVDRSSDDVHRGRAVSKVIPLAQCIVFSKF